MSILYVSCMKFPTNRFVGNFCPKKKWEEKRREWNMIFSISNEMEMHDP